VVEDFAQFDLFGGGGVVGRRRGLVRQRLPLVGGGGAGGARQGESGDQ
jgi:hypothetical protein